MAAPSLLRALVAFGFVVLAFACIVWQQQQHRLWLLDQHDVAILGMLREQPVRVIEPVPSKLNVRVRSMLRSTAIHLVR